MNFPLVNFKLEIVCSHLCSTSQLSEVSSFNPEKCKQEKSQLFGQRQWINKESQSKQRSKCKASSLFTLLPLFPLSDNKDVSVMMSEMDVNAIAGTLKLYFRELPEPLFTDELYPNFAEGIGR